MLGEPREGDDREALRSLIAACLANNSLASARVALALAWIAMITAATAPMPQVMKPTPRHETPHTRAAMAMPLVVGAW